MAKKSKKANRGGASRKKKAMKKAKPAKRAKAKKTRAEARPDSDGSIRASSATADPRWHDRSSIGFAAPGCPYRKSNPHVLMMQPAKHGSRFDTPGALNEPSNRRILA